MTVGEIKAKHDDVKRRLKEHDAARKLIEGELLYLQHVCEHPNMKRWHDSGWGRMSSDEFQCPDCGLRGST